MKRTLIAIAITSVFVVGCGSSDHKGVSVSGEMSNSNSSEIKNVLSRVKDFVQSFTAKTTVQMPASALIAEAAAEFVLQNNFDVEAAKLEFLKGAKFDHWSPIAYANYPNISKVSDWNAVLADFEQTQLKNPNFETLAAKRECAVLAKNGDLEKAQACYKDFVLSLWGAATIVAANSGEQGWPVDPQVRGSVLSSYLIASSTAAELANDLETQIASSLPKDAFSDPVAAKKAIRASLLSLKSDKLLAMSDEAKSRAMKSLLTNPVVDLASKRGITWQASESVYSNMGKGWTISRNGVPWFGEGKLSGKSFDLVVESSEATSLTKRKSIDQTETLNNSQQQKADVQVK